MWYYKGGTRCGTTKGGTGRRTQVCSKIGTGHSTNLWAYLSTYSSTYSLVHYLHQLNEVLKCALGVVPDAVPFLEHTWVRYFRAVLVVCYLYLTQVWHKVSFSNTSRCKKIHLPNISSSSLRPPFKYAPREVLGRVPLLGHLQVRSKRGTCLRTSFTLYPKYGSSSILNTHYMVLLSMVSIEYLSIA